MRILLTNSGPWGTGSFTVAEALLNEFLKLGHEVKLFFPDAGVPSDKNAFYYGNPKHFHIWKFPIKRDHLVIPSFPLMIPDPNPRASAEKTLKEFSQEELDFYFDSLEQELGNLIHTFSPDVIDCGHIWTGCIALEKIKAPYFLTAHHSDQLAYHYDKRLRHLLPKNFPYLNAIFAISEHVKESVTSLYHIDPNKLHVIENGYDTAIFYPQKLDRQEVLKSFHLNIPDDAILFMFAGQISKTKGIDILLEANRILNHPKLHFLIAGKGNPQKIIHPDESERYSFQNVHFLGHLEGKQLSTLNNIADFFILPSRSEGFGIAALEAMACGLPVIGTKSGGLQEFAIGKLVEKNDVNALVKGIEEMLGLDDEEKKELSEKAIKKAQQFSWEKIAKKRLKIYEEEG